MYPLLQSEPEHKDQIQKYGCFYMDMLGIAECVAARMFSTGEVNQIWEDCIAKGYLAQSKAKEGDYDYYIQNSGAIATYALEVLGRDDLRALVVGSRSYCPDYKDWGKGPEDMEMTFSVLCGRTKFGHTHFRLGNHVGQMIYDSEPKVVIVGELRIDWIVLRDRVA